MKLIIKRENDLVNMTLPYKVYIDNECYKLWHNESIALNLENEVYECYVKVLYVKSKKIDIDLTNSSKTLVIKPLYSNVLMISLLVVFASALFFMQFIKYNILELIKYISLGTILTMFYFSTIGRKHYLRLILK